MAVLVTPGGCCLPETRKLLYDGWLAILITQRVGNTLWALHASLKECNSHFFFGCSVWLLRSISFEKISYPFIFMKREFLKKRNFHLINWIVSFEKSLHRIVTFQHKDQAAPILESFDRMIKIYRIPG